MDLEQLRRAYGLTNAKKAEVEQQIEEISLKLVSQRGKIQEALLDQLHQLEVQQSHLKDHAASLQSQLSKRGLTTSEIKNIPIASNAPNTLSSPEFAFPSAPSTKPPLTSSGKESSLIETIQNEKYHQKHIEEVNQWNQQELERQKQIREQNLKLLQLHEQLQQMKISEEQKIAEQRKEVQREQEALKQRETLLNEKQKQQIQEIDEKLSSLRQEQTRLAANRQELPSNQQEAIQALKAERTQILGAPSSLTSELQSSNTKSIHPNSSGGGSFGYQPNSYDGQNYSSSSSSHGNNINSSLSDNYSSRDNVQNYGSNSGNVPSHEHYQQHQNYNHPSSSSNYYATSPNHHNFESQQPSSTIVPPSYSSSNGGGNQQNRLPPTSNLDDSSEINLWKKEQNTLEDWQQRSSDIQKNHQEELRRKEEEYMKSLHQKEEEMRRKWIEDMNQKQRELAQVNQQLTDDVLCRMSEAELRLWMEHAQKNEFIDEMLARRQQLLDEQSWLLQQDLENKKMALSFKEDDLRKREWEIEQERQAELAALSRVFCIIIETTNPEGKRTGKTYQMQVRAGDTLYRICERIPHDKELFCVKLEYNGILLEDLDKNLLELRIPDNAFMISRLLPKADVDVLNLIPCEDCGKRFHAEVFGAHKCMKQYSQELPSQRRKNQPSSSSQTQPRRTNSRTVVSRTSQQVEAIPCEFCEGLFPVHRYEEHYRSCNARRAPVPKVTRYRYHY